jgi:hypothetical protein
VHCAGSRRILTATAKDAGPKPWKKSLKVSQRATVRYWSVDTVGIAERHRKVRLR